MTRAMENGLAESAAQVDEDLLDELDWGHGGCCGHAAPSVSFCPPIVSRVERYGDLIESACCLCPRIANNAQAAISDDDVAGTDELGGDTVNSSMHRPVAHPALVDPVFLRALPPKLVVRQCCLADWPI